MSAAWEQGGIIFTMDKKGGWGPGEAWPGLSWKKRESCEHYSREE